MEDRKPMLSDADLAQMAKTYYDGYECAEQIRTHYESLITTGKLRVVEEVTYKSTWDAWCSKCGTSVMDTSDMMNPLPFAFCPGCGNPIKR